MEKFLPKGTKALPLYPYRCTECGHRFEKIQHFNSKPEEKCPQCGGALERPLTAPAFQFKGSGWYVNDYSGKSSAPAAAAEKSSEAKTPCGGSCGAACPAANTAS
jgi:putative FmdB family regulatory protein